MIALEELRDAALKAFPADRLNPPRDKSWASMVAMGWLAIELEEADGGLDLGRGAAAAVQFELGRTLPSAPLGVALASLRAIAGSTTLTGRETWIERLCAGEYVAQAMLPSSVATAANGSLSGTFCGVMEADMASHVLVAADDRLLLIPLDHPQVAVSERAVWDPSRRSFDVRLDAYTSSSELVVASGREAETMRDMLACSLNLAIAADSIGGANALFALTVDYLKTRRQFGRPLALFQALKHRVADLKVRLEAAEALFWSRAEDASLADLGALKALCTRTFRDMTEDAIQLHGGIGLTEEYPCHLFLKRAMLNSVLAGDSKHWEGVTGCALLAAD